MKLNVVIKNITRQPDAQAVGNSANANLRLGSGVAGAIHIAAGAALEAHFAHSRHCPSATHSYSWIRTSQAVDHSYTSTALSVRRSS
jgi:O-acetyl-ADP-ribose deacetylase (regulator of RNase III)